MRGEMVKVWDLEGLVWWCLTGSHPMMPGSDGAAPAASHTSPSAPRRAAREGEQSGSRGAGSEQRFRCGSGVLRKEADECRDDLVQPLPPPQFSLNRSLEGSDARRLLICCWPCSSAGLPSMTLTPVLSVLPHSAPVRCQWRPARLLPAGCAGSTQG